MQQRWKTIGATIFPYENPQALLSKRIYFENELITFFKCFSFSKNKWRKRHLIIPTPISTCKKNHNLSKNEYQINDIDSNIYRTLGSLHKSDAYERRIYGDIKNVVVNHICFHLKPKNLGQSQTARKERKICVRKVPTATQTNSGFITKETS